MSAAQLAVSAPHFSQPYCARQLLALCLLDGQTSEWLAFTVYRCLVLVQASAFRMNECVREPSESLQVGIILLFKERTLEGAQESSKCISEACNHSSETNQTKCVPVTLFAEQKTHRLKKDNHEEKRTWHGAPLGNICARWDDLVVAVAPAWEGE